MKMHQYAAEPEPVASEVEGSTGPRRLPESLSSRWRSWFRRPSSPETRIDFNHSASVSLTWDYEQLAREACARYAIHPAELRIEAIQIGTTEGKQLYALLLTGANETPESVSRAQLLAPVVEKRIFTAVRTSWIGDQSSFAGVWTRWPSHILLPIEVRSALKRMTARPEA